MSTTTPYTEMGKRRGPRDFTRAVIDRYRRGKLDRTGAKAGAAEVWSGEAVQSVDAPSIRADLGFVDTVTGFETVVAEIWKLAEDTPAATGLSTPSDTPQPRLPRSPRRE